MLARQYRLRQSRDINRVYARGRFGAGGQLQVKALKTRWPQSRVAIVVSRKVSKQAVVRNRIKRRLAAQLALAWETVPVGYDIVVSVREDVSQAPVASLRTQLEAGLAGSGLIIKNTKGQNSNAD
ncbi:MAG TPA: ribonuclease P protein component [Candidatus Saccharimonadales bacterium]|nr:ribonuclease P protein component [Candidatus Saccharimonadales bacterium]